MTPRAEHIARLLHKYFEGTLSAVEADELNHWKAAADLHTKKFSEWTDEIETTARLKTWKNYDLSEIKRRVQEGFPGWQLDVDQVDKPAARKAHRVHFLRTTWFRYAAAIIIIFGIGAYLWNAKQREIPIVQIQPVSIKNDIAPGSNRAVLTLSDGRKVELTPETGSIAEAGIDIRNADGHLSYGKTKKVVFNTMTTPRGGQYQLTLPDGTHVWLNAASSITYPTAFISNNREVTITGEVYFEVTKNTAKPFIVTTPAEEIRVLGTSFNVNAYTDEVGMKTSLVEGSVRIDQYILKPGQAFVNGKIVATNIQQDIAWKNGYFNFDGAGLTAVMRQLARWYDLQVVYEKEPPSIKFVGEMTRNISLNGVLKILKGAGVKFRMEDNRKLVVTP